MHAVSWRFDLINANKVIGEIHPTKGEVSISHDVDGVVMRTLSGIKLDEVESADVDTLNDEVRVYMLDEHGDDNPMGVFRFTGQTQELSSLDPLLHGDMGDRGVLLERSTERFYGVQTQVGIRSTIASVLRDAGITQLSVDPTAAIVEGSIGWDIGTSYGQILQDLCLLGGYYNPWFDADGICQVKQKVTDLNTAPVPVLVYAEGTNILRRTSTLSSDLLAAPNRFIVVSSGPTDYPIVGTYDVPASAPYSIQARGGLVVPDVTSVQGVANVGDAAARAREIAQTKLPFETLSFSSPVDPRHSAFDVVEYLGERWLETVWGMQLVAGGEMTHTLQRVIT